MLYRFVLEGASSAILHMILDPKPQIEQILELSVTMYKANIYNTTQESFS